MRFRMLVGACAFALFAAGCAQTDTGITSAVKGKLVADDLVKARQINVDTQDKVVTLTGEVRSEAEESRALELARATDGVRDVIDQINVVPEAAGLTPLPAPAAP